jgi:ABC-type multidrug transport system fused ATPase/permease subunit
MGSDLIRNILAIHCIPLSSYIAFLYANLYKNKKWWIVFIVLFVSSIFIVGASMAKAPVAWYIFSFVFLLTILNSRIKIKVLIKLASITIAIVLFFYYAYGLFNVMDFETIVFKGGPIGRVLFGQLAGLPNYYQIFPEIHPFLYNI